MIAVAQPGRAASERELARRLGISHTALQKAQRSGRIAPEPDGSWDVEKVRAQLARTADPVRRVVFIKGRGRTGSATSATTHPAQCSRCSRPRSSPSAYPTSGSIR